MHEGEENGRISFHKGESPVAGAFLLGSTIEVNANWKSSSTGQKGLFGKAKKAKGEDLDLVCIASQGLGPKFLCWWGDLDPMGNGAILSHGDDRRGRGGETIGINFPAIPAIIDRLTWLLVAYKPNVSFGMVNGVSTTVTNSDAPNVPLGVFMPDIDAAYNCLVIGQAVKRDASAWSFAEANAMSNIARGGSDGGRQAMLRVGRAWAEQP
jgi:stress response protein SCP2